MFQVVLVAGAFRICSFQAAITAPINGAKNSPKLKAFKRNVVAFYGDKS